MSLRLAVFVSGGGTNLQALLDRVDPRAARVALVVSDRPEAGGLERARRAGVPTRVIAVAGVEESDVAGATIEALERAGVDLVALAGYVRRVPEAVVRRWAGRMLNIHPALLPAFGGHGMYGMRVHRAVLSAGCRVSGATVHLVDEEYDRGPIVAQWPVPVWPGDTPEALAARVLAAEHALYPATVEAAARALARGLRLEDMGGAGVAAFGAADAPDAAAIRRSLGLEPEEERAWPGRS
ncbi:MAG TPA: phosphoribosylglycinamide formyltransferase [Longimicrobiales bacterium]|nr:phosphoribosylglycinamide formyltransferase [Longimicrobiales bacterium]